MVVFVSMSDSISGQAGLLSKVVDVDHFGSRSLQLAHKPQVDVVNDQTGSRSWQFAKHDIAAKPQVLNGTTFWPQDWGITVNQCAELLEQLKKLVEKGEWDPEGNVYELVERYVKPRTASKGVGYALLHRKQHQRSVNVMISHAWGENAMDFLETIL